MLKQIYSRLDECVEIIIQIESSEKIFARFNIKNSNKEIERFN